MICDDCNADVPRLFRIPEFDPGRKICPACIASMQTFNDRHCSDDECRDACPQGSCVVTPCEHNITEVSPCA